MVFVKYDAPGVLNLSLKNLSCWYKYSGDKYENGVITPRPPPIQYGRQRPRDRNRDFNRSRYDREDREGGFTQNRQANQYNNPQGQMQRRDWRNYGPPQNYPPQQNYGPPGQGERRNPMPMNNMQYTPAGSELTPAHQGGYNQWGQQNTYYNQEQRDMPQGDQRNYAPPQNAGNNMNYAPNTPGGSYGQGGQGGGGYHGQGIAVGYGEGAVPNYGQGNMGQGEGQRFSQGDQRNVQGDQGGYGPGGPNQVKHLFQSVICRACR